MPERKLFLPGALQLTIQRLQPGAAADRDVLLRFASRRKFASKLFRLSIQGAGLQSESLNALPFGSERKGIRLLLVVHCGAGEFLALRIGSAYGDSAALAVSRHGNATASGDLAAFLNVELQRMVVNLRVRPHV